MPFLVPGAAALTLAVLEVPGLLVPAGSTVRDSKDFEGSLPLLQQVHLGLSRVVALAAVVDGLSLSLSLCRGCERKSTSGVRCGQHWRKYFA